MGKAHAKVLTVFVLALLLGLLVPSVRADCGPKSSFTYTVVGMDDRVGAGLMFRVGSAVEPYSEEEMAANGWDELPLFAAMNGYRDPDGFVLLGLYWPYMDDGIPIMYYWPAEVKCAVIDAGGSVYISEAITPRMFYAEVTFDFDGVEPAGAVTFAGTASERFPVVRILLDFVLRLAGTLAIELALLWLFGYRTPESFRSAALVNLITQTILTVGVLDGHYVGEAYYAFGVLLAGELLVFAAETIVYARILTERGKRKAVVYALAANAASFVLSLLMILVPGCEMIRCW